MAEVWQTDFPCYPLEGTWTEKDQDNVVRFQPEVGNSKSRRRFTASGSTATGSWKFSKSQWVSFQAWWKTGILDGSLPFLMKHPISDDMIYWTFEEPPEMTAVTRNAITATFSLRRSF